VRGDGASAASSIITSYIIISMEKYVPAVVPHVDVARRGVPVVPHGHHPPDVVHVASDDRVEQQGAPVRVPARGQATDDIDGETARVEEFPQLPAPGRFSDARVDRRVLHSNTEYGIRFGWGFFYRGRVRTADFLSAPVVATTANWQSIDEIDDRRSSIVGVLALFGHHRESIIRVAERAV
jgi:hypothetical protein